MRMAWNPQHPTERRPTAVLEVWLSEVPAAVETWYRDQVTLVAPETTAQHQRSTEDGRQRRSN